MKKKLIILTSSLFILDRAIKTLIAFLIPFQDNVVVIKDFFYITYVKNVGAAWSIFSGHRLLLIVIAFLALTLFYYLFLKESKLNNYKVICYSLLLGGILGNLFDRIFYGYVIDYLRTVIFNYNFPIFNLADTFIVISVILISYELLREGEIDE